MCVCKMIGGCMDGMEYRLPDDHDGCVVIERPPGPKEELWYHLYQVVQRSDGGYVGICVEESMDRPEPANLQAAIRDWVG